MENVNSQIHVNDDTETVYVYIWYNALLVRFLQLIALHLEACGRVVMLPHDQSRSIDDMLKWVGGTVRLYTDMPLDKAVELKQRMPHITLRLLDIDERRIEEVARKPYNPEADYHFLEVLASLKSIELTTGSVRYMTFSEMIRELSERGFKRVGVYNDVVRKGFRLALNGLGAELELVKICDGYDVCVQINPPLRSGYHINFPVATWKSTPEQISEMLFSDARIYYAEIERNTKYIPFCIDDP